MDGPDSTPRRPPRRRAHLITGSLAGTLVTGAVLSGGGTAVAVQTEPGPAELAVVFVLDLSGSMNRDATADSTRLDVAKDALADYLARTTAETQFGIRVYGDRYPSVSPDQRQESCAEDTRTLIPVGDLERDAAIATVTATDLRARGDTPIAVALQAAAGDLPEGTMGKVVLVSDGRDECFDADLDGDPARGPSWGDDPCEVAAEIADQGVAVQQRQVTQVDTIALNADAAALQELRCIAEVTGGLFIEIEEPTQLADALLRTGTPRTALRLPGIEVSGGAQRSDAPDLSELGEQALAEHGARRFLDTIAIGEEKWYSFPGYGPGEADITATIFSPPSEDLALNLVLAGSSDNDGTLERSSDAGVPQSPSASVRCPGCAWSSGEGVDSYFVVSLSSESRTEGVYDLELALEGPAVGDADRQDNAGVGMDEQLVGVVSEIDDVKEQIAGMEGEMEDLEAEAALGPADAETRSRRDSREGQVERDQAELSDIETAAANGQLTNWPASIALALGSAVTALVLALGGMRLSRRLLGAASGARDAVGPHSAADRTDR